MDIPAFLARQSKPRVIDDFSHDRTRLLEQFAKRGQQICRRGNAQFVFLESGEMNAFAIQDEAEFVAVYAGMFWMLCRLSATVAGSGVFPVMEGLSEPVWAPDTERSLRTPRELLRETVAFEWDIESQVWRDAPERKILFDFVLDILFQFVVFHELGHLHNDHTRRRTGGASPFVAIDSLGPDLVDRSVALPSQAREIIADCTALAMTLGTVNWELAANSNQESFRVIREKLVPDTTSLVGFVLTVVNLYFRLSDRSDWLDVPLDRLSHPPAPYRMMTLFAYVWDSRPLKIDDGIAEQAVKHARASSDILMSVMLNVFPSPDGMEHTAKPEHSAHYRDVYEESARWIGPLDEANGTPEP